MITVDKINRTLAEAETYSVPVEFDGDRNMQIVFLLSKALIHAIVYAAETIASAIKSR